MIGHAFPHVRVNLITSTHEAVTVALAGMVIEKLSRLPDLVGLGSHLAVTKFSQLFEVTPLIPVVNSYSGHVQFSPDI